MNFIEQIINGLSTGSMYALVAVGYTMVYGIAKMINFAHGEIIMVGAYITYACMSIFNIPVIIAVLLSIIGCAILGVVTEKIAYRPLRSSGSLTVLITAIGVSYLLQNLFLIIFGSASLTFPKIIPSGTIRIGTLSMSYVTIATLVITAISTVILLYFINKTKLGKAMRAVSEDGKAAQLMGINVDTTIALTFAIGSALAAIAGVIYGTKFSLINPYIGAMLGIKAFIAAVLGGIGSIQGAMIGGIVIGIAESFTITYISSAFSDAVVFGILIFILLVKPSGIFGNNVREKV